MSEITQTKFEGWALVEIMGHRRAAGMVTTEYIGTAAFLRVVTPEYPAEEYKVEQPMWIDGVGGVQAGTIMKRFRQRSEVLIGTGSIYAINPCREIDVLGHAPLTHEVVCLPVPLMLDAPAEHVPMAAAVDKAIVGEGDEVECPF